MPSRTIPVRYWWQILHDLRPGGVRFTGPGSEPLDEIISAIEKRFPEMTGADRNAELTIEFSDAAAVIVDHTYGWWLDFDSAGDND